MGPFFSLPHLFAPEITIFDQTLEPAAYFEEFPQSYQAFDDYFPNFWIDKVTPEHCTVFGRQKAKNDIESYRAQQIKKFKIAHPSFWFFYRTFKTNIASTAVQNRQRIDLNKLSRPKNFYLKGQLELKTLEQRFRERIDCH